MCIIVFLRNCPYDELLFTESASADGLSSKIRATQSWWGSKHHLRGARVFHEQTHSQTGRYQKTGSKGNTLNKQFSFYFHFFAFKTELLNTKLCFLIHCISISRHCSSHSLHWQHINNLTSTTLGWMQMTLSNTLVEITSPLCFPGSVSCASYWWWKWDGNRWRGWQSSASIPCISMAS